MGDLKIKKKRNDKVADLVDNEETISAEGELLPKDSYDSEPESQTIIADVTKRSDKVITALIEYIKKNNLKPNDKLPSQSDLCKLFGVGNTSMREALVILQALGVIRSQHGMGWYIGDFNVINSLQVIAPLIQNFSDADSDAIMQTRLLLEPGITRLAAQHITEKGLQQLNHAFKRMQETASDPFLSEFREQDRIFHLALSRECGNPVLRLLGTLLTGLFFSQVYPSGEFEETVKHHQNILEAVKRIDPQGAEKAMADHIQWAASFFGLKEKEV
jgi:DNA-binding FadR family transcriptional regulator